MTPDGKLDENMAMYYGHQRRHTPTSQLMMQGERQFLDDFARTDKRNSSF